MYPIEQIEKHANNSRVIVWHIIGGIEQTGFVSEGRILLDRHRDFGKWTSLENYSHFIKLSELNRILTDKFYN